MISTPPRRPRQAKQRLVMSVIENVNKQIARLDRSYEVLKELSPKEIHAVAHRAASMQEGDLIEWFSGYVLRVWGPHPARCRYLSTKKDLPVDTELATAVDSLNQALYRHDEFALRLRTAELFGGRLPDVEQLDMPGPQFFLANLSMFIEGVKEEEYFCAKAGLTIEPSRDFRSWHQYREFLLHIASF
jgi:hypothetical protein